MWYILHPARARRVFLWQAATEGGWVTDLRPDAGSHARPDAEPNTELNTELDEIAEEIPEVVPDEQVEEIFPEAEDEGAPRAIDPAFVYIIFVIVTLVGLSKLAVDVRYTLVWTLLAAVAVVAIVLDKVEIEPITMPNLLTGLGFGALIGVPLLAIGAPQLQHVSLLVFGQSSETSVFQMLAFTMPLAETLYFRGAFQAARGLIFTSIAAGLWSIIMFFPQLDVLKVPLVAAVIGLCLVFANFVYSYLRERFGLFASWSCQIAVNLLLLFACRFAG